MTADIAAGTALCRCFEFDIDRPSVLRVEACYMRFRERPAYARRVMIPFADLREQLAFLSKP